MTVSATASSKREVLETLPIWTPPLMGAIEVLPDLTFILPHGIREITKRERAGWIDIRVDHHRSKIPFQFGGRWNLDMIRNLKGPRLAQLIMRGLHPRLMQAKHDGKLDYFIIKGLAYETHVGFGLDYITY
jgi:hypothetical protein